MPDERPPRKIEVSLGLVATILGIVLTSLLIYGLWSTSAREDTKEDVTIHITLDSASARAVQAMAWINHNAWYIERKLRRDSTLHN
jgi:hypothetical protein